MSRRLICIACHSFSRKKISTKPIQYSDKSIKDYVVFDIKDCSRSTAIMAESKSRTIPSFQLGAVTLVGNWLAGCWLVVVRCRMSAVRAINRSTSQRAARRQMLYLLTLYPAESWAPRERAHEFVIYR